MKIALALFSLLTLASAAQARCVVEVMDADGEPMGHVFQGETCAPIMRQCREYISRLRTPGAVCEITLDIGALSSPAKNSYSEH